MHCEQATYSQMIIGGVVMRVHNNSYVHMSLSVNNAVVLSRMQKSHGVYFDTALQFTRCDGRCENVVLFLSYVMVKCYSATEHWTHSHRMALAKPSIKFIIYHPHRHQQHDLQLHLYCPYLVSFGPQRRLRRRWSTASAHSGSCSRAPRRAVSVNHIHNHSKAREWVVCMREW